MRPIWKLVPVIAVVAVVSIWFSKFFRNPLVDISLTADGTTRSPPFRLYKNTTYQLFIGLDPMAVDEATCAAVHAAQSNPVPTPCKKLRPPFGPLQWIVTQGSQEIARGSVSGEPADVLRDRNNPWSKDKAMTWGSYSGWFGHPGRGYVIEVHLKSSSVDLAAYHPRFAIVEPL